MINKEQLHRRIELAGNKKPSMLRRKQDHDYQSRRMYMVTMVTEDRQPLFGTVVGDPHLPVDSPGAPRTVPSELGVAIESEWNSIHDHYPQIMIVAFQLMPDHFHGILFVRERIPLSLGTILNGFKTGCRHAFQRVCPVEYAVAKQRQTEQMEAERKRRGSQTRRNANRQSEEHGILFHPGYNDKILLREGQLDNWKRYLADNPRRLLVKREHPEFFRVQRSITWKGMKFSAIGNLFLLRKPLLMQVQCSRSLIDEQITARVEQSLAACQQGAVLVSPSISPGEKAVMRAAFTAGFPEIILKNNGFAPLTKPSGASFDACASGQLLFLGPTFHSNENKTIKRSECLNLNDIAERLCR